MKKQYGLYVIITYLAFLLIQWVSYLFKGANSKLLIFLEFGSLPYVILGLIVISLLSHFFIKHKVKWVISSLPFIWFLFSPIKSAMSGLREGLFFNLLLLFQGMLGGKSYILFTEILFIIAVFVYSYIKFTDKELTKRNEIIFAIILIVLYLV